MKKKNKFKDYFRYTKDLMMIKNYPFLMRMDIKAVNLNIKFKKLRLHVSFFSYYLLRSFFNQSTLGNKTLTFSRDNRSLNIESGDFYGLEFFNNKKTKYKLLLLLFFFNEMRLVDETITWFFFFQTSYLVQLENKIFLYKRYNHLNTIKNMWQGYLDLKNYYLENKTSHDREKYSFFANEMMHSFNYRNVLGFYMILNDWEKFSNLLDREILKKEYQLNFIVQYDIKKKKKELGDNYLMTSYYYPYDIEYKII